MTKHAQVPHVFYAELCSCASCASHNDLIKSNMRTVKYFGPHVLFWTEKIPVKLQCLKSKMFYSFARPCLNTANSRLHLKLLPHKMWPCTHLSSGLCLLLLGKTLFLCNGAWWGVNGLHTLFDHGVKIPMIDILLVPFLSHAACNSYHMTYSLHGNQDSHTLSPYNLCQIFRMWEKPISLLVMKLNADVPTVLIECVRVFPTYMSSLNSLAEFHILEIFFMYQSTRCVDATPLLDFPSPSGQQPK